MNTRQTGLTLVELVVALAVLALLTTLGISHLRPLLEQQRRETLAEELLQDLRAAKVEAIMRNRKVILAANEENWALGWRMIDDASGRGAEDETNPVLRVRYGTQGIRAVPTPNMASQAAFDYLGRPVLTRGGSLAASLYLCNDARPHKHLRVVIARTGRVRVSRETPVQRLCLTPPA